MADVVPAARIAGIALRHVEIAITEVSGSSFSSSGEARVKARLAMAAELLALIAPPAPAQHPEAPPAPVDHLDV